MRDRTPRNAPLLFLIVLLGACAVSACGVVDDHVFKADEFTRGDEAAGVSEVVAPRDSASAPHNSPARATPGSTDSETDARTADLTVTVSIDSVAPRVGETVEFQLEITNPTEQDIQATTIGTGGPWDSYRLLRIRPNGVLRRDPAGWYVVTALPIPAGQTRRLSIEAIPRQLGESTFTFSARGRAVK